MTDDARKAKLRERAAQTTDASMAKLRGLAPKLVELSVDTLMGEIWERPELAKRDRSIATVAMLIALDASPTLLANHVRRALANGLTREEIGELITHAAFYAGWPNAMNAAHIAHSVIEGE